MYVLYVCSCNINTPKLVQAAYKEKTNVLWQTSVHNYTVLTLQHHFTAKCLWYVNVCIYVCQYVRMQYVCIIYVRTYVCM